MSGFKDAKCQQAYRDAVQEKYGDPFEMMEFLYFSIEKGDLTPILERAYGLKKMKREAGVLGQSNDN